MPKPNIDFNPRTQQWEFKGRDGMVKARVDEAGVGFGNAGNVLSRLIKLTGTLPLTNVATAASAVATITGMTGIAVGDIIAAVNPKAALTDTNMVLSNERVLTTNVVNVTVVNNRSTSSGSLAAVGIDVLAIRAV